MENNTIAAMATPLGYSALGVIRVSGAQSHQIVQKVFQFAPAPEPKKIKTFHLYLGKIQDPFSGKFLDQVLVSFMTGPTSYTAENMAEIFCHGNPLILKQILNLLFILGARPAKRGEFTQRAFLAGKINLLEAEAVLNLVQAPSATLLDNLVHHLTGETSQEIAQIRDNFVRLLTKIEVGLDFPEDVGQVKMDSLTKEIKRNYQKIQEMVAASEKLAKNQGLIRVALVGQTNTGKSTLFNALAKSERAIVSHLPGTTRDFLEEDILIEDTIFRIVDTAGFEKKPGLISQLALKRTQQIIIEAEIILFLIDGSKKKVSRREKSFLKKLQSEKRKFLVVINKNDLYFKARRIQNSIKTMDLVGNYISALYQKGLKRLLSKIYQLYKKHYLFQPEKKFLFNLRQTDLLRKTLKHLGPFLNLPLEKNEEIYAWELQQALKSLDELTGRTFTEDVLNQIFENFCIGK